MNQIRIGTRNSKLALIQTGMVSDVLRMSGIDAKIIEIETAGDIDRESPISSMGGTGVFVSALNEQIIDGRIDIAVHSAKDIPTVLPDRVEIAGAIARGPVEDMFISEVPLERLEPGSVVGTSSLRRSLELKFIRSDLTVKSIRGNIETRVRKYREGQYDAIIMARAAYDRLHITDNAYELDVQTFPPAANQGIIAVTALSGSEHALTIKKLSDQNALSELYLERSILSELKLSCNDPVAVLARGVNPARIFVRVYSLIGRGYKDFETSVRNVEEASDFASGLKEKIPEGFGYRWKKETT
ncbi:MAG: hydroxymethylbilane synthase [Candidatus Thermoplasmatota archaeon]|nr:hydroxymethylbilane synthase [Candidatus Thermoplasmatota archaeon]